MKYLSIVFTTPGLVSCTQFATIKEIEPERVGFRSKPTAAVDTLERSVSAAEAALRRLERNPLDVEAQADYNFAVSRDHRHLA